MGIIADWKAELKEALEANGLQAEEVVHGNYHIISIANKAILLNLLSLSGQYHAEDLVRLQEAYAEKNIHLVHLWEDVWSSKRSQVISRLISLAGLNQRIHARKTTVLAISSMEASSFLNANHLQGYARAKHKLALVTEGMIVAVACFSKLRIIDRGSGQLCKSAEVVRFATLSGYTVTGGFSKLLRFFMENYRPDDVMSYADRDWSNGKVYLQSGFTLVSCSPPAELFVDLTTMTRYFPHRLAEAQGTLIQGSLSGKYVRIFNTGNLKYLYYA